MKTKNKKLKQLILCAMFAAISFSVTYFIPPVPLPFGYANLGDCTVLLSAFIIGGLWGAVAGGLGPCLADLFLGYGIYSPATFIIKTVMAFLAFMIFKKARNTQNKPVSFLLILAGCIAAEAVMVLGYFIFELFLYGAGAFASLPGNLLQGAVNTVAATAIILVIKNDKAISKFF